MVNEDLKGVVRDIGAHFQVSQCYLSLETVCNPFHSVLIVAKIAGARLVQVMDLLASLYKVSFYFTMHIFS